MRNSLEITGSVRVAIFAALILTFTLGAARVSHGAGGRYQEPAREAVAYRLSFTDTPTPTDPPTVTPTETAPPTGTPAPAPTDTPTPTDRPVVTPPPQATATGVPATSAPTGMPATETSAPLLPVGGGGQSTLTLAAGVLAIPGFLLLLFGPMLFRRNKQG